MLRCNRRKTRGEFARSDVWNERMPNDVQFGQGALISIGNEWSVSFISLPMQFVEKLCLAAKEQNFCRGHAYEMLVEFSPDFLCEWLKLDL